jgi:heme/copper-type cytochrome/quinol oxidase subunit 2
MVSQTVITIVAVALIFIVLTLAILFIYFLMKGESANEACKTLISTLLGPFKGSIELIAAALNIDLRASLCDIIIPQWGG